MKKISILSLFIALALASCSGQSAPGEKSLPENKPASSAAVAGKVQVLNKDSFKAQIMDYEKNPQQWVYVGDKPAIIDFYADWCRPCKMIAPIMEELATEYAGKVNIYKVNTDQERELAALFNITSIPYVLFIPASGNPSSQKGALSKEAYKQVIDEFLLARGAGKL